MQSTYWVMKLYNLFVLTVWLLRHAYFWNVFFYASKTFRQCILNTNHKYFIDISFWFYKYMYMNIKYIWVLFCIIEIVFWHRFVSWTLYIDRGSKNLKNADKFNLKTTIRNFVCEINISQTSTYSTFMCVYKYLHQ